MAAKVWIWSIGSLIAAGGLYLSMSRPDVMQQSPVQRTVFLPGETTDGHYQIELACNECHGASFTDQASMQDACVGCHGPELDLVDDSHPQRKFTDPRNVERVAALDARWCVTCHQEHRPEVTATMGLSLPGDYCYRCHEDVGDERPTHQGLAFDSCATSGCHNFHDNRALYEDFLVEHRAEPWLLDRPMTPERALLAWARAHGHAGERALVEADADAPATVAGLDEATADWVGTSHARAGVNCSDCHAPGGAAWRDQPAPADCAGCHELEHAGFTAGRHGMRLSVGLPPMTPGQARLPMHPDVMGVEVDCQSCHGAHGYDTRYAAAEACLGCHADDHTLAWEASSHAALWRAESAGEAPAGSGVSCATCHLPRLEQRDGTVRVAHNQNDTLRPGDKMIRPVCMDCHGLGFALDALADEDLARTNYDAAPSTSVDSIHFAAELRWELEGKRPPWNEETHKEGEE